MIQLAKSKGLGNEIEEALFKVHFSEKKNIDDEEVLVETGASVGIDRDSIKQALASGEYAEKVKQDELQAQEFGVRGVPFFVFNNKYGVSGAQPAETFLDIIKKAHQESRIQE